MPPRDVDPSADPRSAAGPPAGLRLPPDASPDEAAAIAAAVEALLDEEARAAGDGATGGDDRWTGRRFAFAGRLTKVDAAPARVPPGAPADPWSAAGRAERF